MYEAMKSDGVLRKIDTKEGLKYLTDLISNGE